MQSNSPSSLLLNRPKAVTLVYATAKGDVEVTVDPATVGAVVWDAGAAREFSPVRSVPGQAPPGVQVQSTTSSADTVNATGVSTEPAPSSCYWVGGQLYCC